MSEYSISRTVSVEAGCEDLDSSSITETVTHGLLELDFFNHDDVNWLRFRSRMTLDCTFESCESFTAPFKFPISRGNTGSTALARATLQ